MKAYNLYGPKWDLVEEYVETRNTNQILNYAEKLFGNVISI